MPALKDIENPERAAELISKASGKSNEEITRLISEKKEKFSGLLTDAGAAFMIAKELGVELGKAEENVKISALKDGMNNVDVVGRAKTVFPPKSFERNGRKGVLQSIILWDGSGEVRATLWHKDVEKFAGLNVKMGQCIKLGNCSVSSYNGALQLGLNYNSSIAKESGESVPEIEKKLTELNELDNGMNDVNVIVKIKKVFPAREFETEKGKGKVLNFIVGQGVEEVRATAWNSLSEEVEKFSEGDEVKIEGAYTKQGRDGTELHLGNYARILKADKGPEA